MSEYRDPPPDPMCPRCVTREGVESCDPPVNDPHLRWHHLGCDLFFTGSQTEFARYATARADDWARRQATASALRDHKGQGT